MPPTIATIICVCGVLGLFWLDRDSETRTSKALLIPVMWLSIAGSRAVSQWMAAFGFGDAAPMLDSPDQILDGSPVDRTIFAILMAVGLGVLIQRRRRVGQILRANLPIVLFFLYCVISVLWSEQTAVAFKRWIKAAGDLLMMLIVVSEVDLSEALKRLFAWTSFLLIPFSVLLIKYYPNLAVEYNRWTWTPQYAGVTTNKNSLGVICLVFGLGAVWRFVSLYQDLEVTRRKQRLLAQSVILTMVLWLFWVANSMTSLFCSILGCALILVTTFSRRGHRPVAVHAMVTAAVLSAVLLLFFNPAGFLLQNLGRNSTLTGRTDIWSRVLPLAGNPFFGTGFESFWLGKRLETMWAYNRDIHQAHNGYLEIYLNLGWIGLTLLATVLATGYSRVVNGVRRRQEAGSLWLALFVVAIIYNFTEAAFGMMSLVWMFLLLAITSLSRPATATSNVPAHSRMPIDPFHVEGGSINHAASDELAGLCANFELKDEHFQDGTETEQRPPFQWPSSNDQPA